MIIKIKLETMTIIRVNIWVVLIKNVIQNFILKKKLNVFFHNLKGYDSHFLIQEIGKFNKKMSILPTNTEKFISFSIGNVIFKDSLQFMSDSLENLTKKSS